MVRRGAAPRRTLGEVDAAFVVPEEVVVAVVALRWLPRHSRRAAPREPVRRGRHAVDAGVVAALAEAAATEGLEPRARVRLVRVAVDADAAALEHHVVARADGRQVRPHAGEVEQPQLWLVPRDPVSGVRVQEDLRAAAAHTVAVPQLPRRSAVTRGGVVHHVRVAVVQPRLPRLVLHKQRVGRRLLHVPDDLAQANSGLFVHESDDGVRRRVDAGSKERRAQE